MKIEDLERRLAVLREQRSRIDYAIEFFETQLIIEKSSREKSSEKMTVQPAETGGSYVLQEIKCGKPTCHCSKPGGKLHGPYWHLYTKKDGRTKCKYLGKTKPIGNL
ncbi:MAG: hypothetical protein LUQ38_00285 [Methanotrichaceae archaeon]|nr:hypothetical protein [Methanotrichaceae archaeon]